jgi:hypothetical protein
MLQKQLCNTCNTMKHTLKLRARFICDDCKANLQINKWRQLQTINNGNVVERGL